MLKQRGYITLLGVLVLGVIGLAITLFVLSFGLNSYKNSSVVEYSVKSRFLADLCAEKALQQIKDDPNFSGNFSTNLFGGSCSYTVIKFTGENREVRASGNYKNVVRKVKIIIDKINPNINIVLWFEVSDF